MRARVRDQRWALGCALAVLLVGCGEKSEGATAADARVDARVTPPRHDGGTVERDSAVPPEPEYDGGLIDPITPGDDAPELTSLGYFNDALGLRILMRGRDPNGDIASYTIKLFKGTVPALVDVDGDQIAAESEFTGPLTALPDTASFVYRMEPSLELLENVDTIKVTVFDRGKRASKELTAKLGRAPAPTTTSPCDPLGFAVCTGTNVCSFNNMRTSCAAVSTARSVACNGALELTPPSVTSVRAEALFSLWNAPASCLTADPTSRPDRVVKLRLASDAATVVLSTANDYTNFDTALYLLEDCRMDPGPCTSRDCACADDSPGSNKAILTLTDVKANTDYFVVVDSFRPYDPLNHRFELTVSVQ